MDFQNTATRCHEMFLRFNDTVRQRPRHRGRGVVAVHAQTEGLTGPINMRLHRTALCLWRGGGVAGERAILLRVGASCRWRGGLLTRPLAAQGSVGGDCRGGYIYLEAFSAGAREIHARQERADGRGRTVWPSMGPGCGGAKNRSPQRRFAGMN